MATVAEFLDKVSGLLKESGFPTREEEGQIAFDSRLGATTVRAWVDPDGPTSDLSVGNVVVSTALDWPPNRLDQDQLARINSWAGMSALSKDETTGRFLISTQLSWGTEINSRAIAIFASSIALLQAETMIGLIQLLAGTAGTPLDLAGKAEPIETLEMEIELAEKHLKVLGILVFADPTGLTAELPMRAGEKAMILGHLTSLLEFNGTLSHPILGQGLAYRLTLPQNFDLDYRDQLADMLNNMEAAAKFPGAPGAWGKGKLDDSLGFSGFIPTFAYPEGSSILLVDWLRRKHNSASFVVKPLSERSNEQNS